MNEAAHITQHWGIREKLGRYLTAIQNLGLAGFLARAMARRSGGSLPSKDSKHQMNVRSGTSDMWVFDQIFVDRDYRCLDGLSNIRMIIDVDAKVG